MRALSELPPEIDYYCSECKAERRFRLSGFARFGYYYVCTVCGRLRIFEDAELDWIIWKMRK